MIDRPLSALIPGILLLSSSAARAQSATLTAPATSAEVGAFDVQIVRRAEALLSSPQHWNRTDRGACPRADTTYSVRCALRRAVVEAAGLAWNAAPTAAHETQSATPIDCSMDVSRDNLGGSCGTLWEELPVFNISRANAITSGVWRKDAQPTEIWSGSMSDAEGPVNYESRRGADMAGRPTSSDPLIDFNNDTTISFEKVRSYFAGLEDRLRVAASADLPRAAESVEIEIYTGGNGVIRTYNGWFPVSGFSTRGSTIQFQIDTSKEIPPNSLDREILEHAMKILSSDSVWNRADNRECPASATTWSIYCAVEKAQVEVAGGFHHRRPAGELVREIVDERTKARNYHHRLMDYNNDPTTTRADVRSLFEEAIARIDTGRGLLF